MVKSQVIIDRKDFVKVIEILTKLESDIDIFKECKDDRVLDNMSNHIANIQNILIEE